MRDNFINWAIHYKDILEIYYERFYLYVLTFKDDPPEYNVFIRYCYANTRKIYYPPEDKLIAPIY